MSFSTEDLDNESTARLAKCEWLYERGTTCPEKDEEGFWFARCTSEVRRLESVTKIYGEVIEELKGEKRNGKAPEGQDDRLL